MKRFVFLAVVGLMACGTNTHKMHSLSTNAIKKDSTKIVEVNEDSTINKKNPFGFNGIICDFSYRLNETNNDTLKSESNDIDTSKVYAITEQMPQFPGGNEKLLLYINKTLKYPEISQENGIQGIVVCRFIVTKNGKVERIEVLKSLDILCNKEAIRLVKSLPKFIPGKQDGINVNVWYTLPITFKLE